MSFVDIHTLAYGKTRWVFTIIFLGYLFFNTANAETSIPPNSPCLGNPIPPMTLDGLVFPAGEGLPAGSGTTSQGEFIFQQRCQSCHGQEGIGATSVELVGEHTSLTESFPVKAIGSYWPAAPTLLSFIRQAMPPQNNTMSEPRLSHDESYAVVAYILWLNGLWSSDSPLDAKQLAAIQMPNRNGFDDSVLAQHARTYSFASRCVD